ncbi:MAG: DUF2782 domain-containing protein [Proteobacteria bacterium]|nr:DUF2782 domain-containing protein [Pseudomonadota bacterium]
MNIRHLPWLLLAFAFSVSAEELALPEDNYDEDQIEIVEGEQRVIYEYRQNGILTMIKIVPKNGGRPYYMVPADGAPHYESLDHKRKLYPQWVIKEW